MLCVQHKEVLERIGDNKNSHFEMSVKFGKAKLDQYFGMLMDETPFYYAAPVLHPSYKMAWFKDKWRRYPAWISPWMLG